MYAYMVYMNMKCTQLYVLMAWRISLNVMLQDIAIANKHIRQAPSSITRPYSSHHTALTAV